MDAKYAYSFAAKGIQRYIFGAGKLRDLIGASDLVAGLASQDGNDWLKLLLDELAKGSGGDFTGIRFSRRAGGAFCAHGDSQSLVRLRAQWRLAVMTRLPGLEFTDGFGSGGTDIAAMRACQGAAPLRANMAARVPPMGRPVHLPAPRTGRPAVARFYYKNRFDDGEEVLADAIVAPHLQGKPDGVAARMVTGLGPGNSRWQFPRNLDWRDGNSVDNPLFPWRNASAHGEPEDQRIAVVHADISGLGEAFRSRGDGFTQAAENLELSGKIEAAVLAAVAAATRDTLLPHAQEHSEDNGMLVVPARPVVIGGDDITVIVRADLALPFTIALLSAIEAETANRGVPLSAGAGVAIANKGLPFTTLGNLAESLCGHAKQASKQGRLPSGCYPSALAFHHQTQTAEEHYAEDILPHLKGPDGLVISANPYPLDCAAAKVMGGCTAAALVGLAHAIAALPGAAGALREVQSGVLASPGAANARWHRFVSYSRKKHATACAGFEAALLDAGLSASDFEVPRADDGRCPLFDARTLIDVGMVAIAPEAVAA